MRCLKKILLLKLLYVEEGLCSTLKSLICKPILVNEKLIPVWNAVFTEKSPQGAK